MYRIKDEGSPLCQLSSAFSTIVSVRSSRIFIIKDHLIKKRMFSVTIWIAKE